MYSEQERYERAKKIVRKKKAFYSNLFSWITVCSILFFINIKTSPYHIWAIYPFLGWGLGVAMEGFSIYGANGILASEEEEIEKEMALMNINREEPSSYSSHSPAFSDWEEEEADLELPVIPKMWNNRDFV